MSRRKSKPWHLNDPAFQALVDSLASQRLEGERERARQEEREALRAAVGAICATHLSNRGAVVALAVEQIRNVFDVRPRGEEPKP